MVKSNEEEMAKKKAAADGIIVFYIFAVIMNVVQIKDQGLKTAAEVGIVGFIGVILIFTGMDLALKPERKKKIIGDILVFASIWLLFLKSLI